MIDEALLHPSWGVRAGRRWRTRLRWGAIRWRLLTNESTHADWLAVVDGLERIVADHGDEPDVMDFRKGLRELSARATEGELTRGREVPREEVGDG